MKTISQHLTAGALAIAGTVATFGLGNAAQAVTANATFGGANGGGVLFNNAGDPVLLGAATSIVFGNTTGSVNFVPTTYTPFGGSSANNDFNTANSLDLGSTIAEFTTYTATFGGGSTLSLTNPLSTPLLLTWGSGTSPVNRYTFTTTSAAVTAQNNSNANVLFIGTFSDSDGFFTSGPASVSYSFSSSGVGQGTNAMTFGTPPSEIIQGTPEPGTVLGILAVAGAGAFARRKR
jgi:hypothetical protein